MPDKSLKMVDLGQDGPHRVLDYVVKMHRFNDEELLYMRLFEKTDAAGDAGMDGMVDMLFKFDGTIGRKQWWVCGIVTFIVVGLINWVIGLIADATTIGALSYLILIPTIAMLWILIALDVKRLRDRGKDSILMFVLPIVIVPWGIVECGFLPGKD